MRTRARDSAIRAQSRGGSSGSAIRARRCSRVAVRRRCTAAACLMGRRPAQTQDSGDEDSIRLRSGARPGYSPPPGPPGQRRSAPGRSRGQRGSQVPRGVIGPRGRAAAYVPGRPARLDQRGGGAAEVRRAPRNPRGDTWAKRSPHALKFVVAWLAMRCSSNVAARSGGKRPTARTIAALSPLL